MGETPKTAKHDPDLLESGSYSFHGSRGHATLYCWALKRHLENLAQREYLDEFIFNLEDLKSSKPKSLTEAFVPRHHPGQEDPRQIMEFFLLEAILRVKPCNILKNYPSSFILILNIFYRYDKHA